MDVSRDQFATDSDYEEAIESELANEERLLHQLPAYSLCINHSTVSESLAPRPSDSEASSHQHSSSSSSSPSPYLSHFQHYHAQQQNQYGTNKIKTSSYTWYNFIFLNLAIQFRRYYNIYFLIAAILGLFPSISPLNPIANVIPLLIVVVLTCLKDGYADIKKHRADRVLNNHNVVICREGTWQNVKSKDVRVGDLMIINRDEKVMADCVLLKISKEDDVKNEGGCFIETSDLDGESNIKRKEVHPLIREHLYKKRKLNFPNYNGSFAADQELLASFDGMVDCEPPNDSIHSFMGLMKLANIQGHYQRSPPSSPNDYDEEFHDNDASSSPKVLPLGHPGSPQECALNKAVLTVPLHYLNFLPRAASLKSTEYAIAVVIYVGPNTKVFKNLKKKKPGKVSTLTSRLNTLMLMVFTFNFIALSFATLFGGLFLKNKGQYSEYLLPPPYSRSISYVSLEQLAAFYILFQYMVPISLFISIELARLGLAVFFQWDHHLAAKYGRQVGPLMDKQATTSSLHEAGGEENDSLSKSNITMASSSSSNNKLGKQSKMFYWREDGYCQVKNFNLHEDLAKIKYIFSDKTGTLTKNVMKVSKWGIWKPATGSEGAHLQIFDEEEVAGALLRERSNDVNFYKKHIALCHSVLPTARDNGEIAFEGQSPDEIALLEGISKNGVLLEKRTKKKMHLKITDGSSTDVVNQVTHEDVGILQTIDFTSERKKMSIIMRARDGPTSLSLPENSGVAPATSRILWLSKGADSVMIPNLSISQQEKDHFQEEVDNMSRKGLRVLVLGYKALTEDQFKVFRKAYDSAESSISCREVLISRLLESWETNYELVGLVAVEDKLADFVPSTLEFFIKAEIRVWLLTGDKLETAINISRSSRLILPNMKVCIIDSKSKRVENFWLEMTKLTRMLLDIPSDDDSTNSEYVEIQNLLRVQVDPSTFSEYESRLEQCILAAEAHTDGSTSLRVSRSSMQTKAGLALVLDGSFIDLAVHFKSSLFITLALRCSSVVVCRASPLQKSLVVSLVKAHTSDVTLAIGDGANDVSMIETADIGVGITGREGGQASRAADYSISEFQFLKRLLVVHGRYSYLRLSKLILISIYKNFVLAMCQFWFGIYSGYSAQTLYNSIFLLLYNVIFTSIAPMTIALFEKDVSEKLLMRYPKLYTPLARGYYFTYLQIAKTFLWGLIHSVVIFFINAALFYGNDISNSNGKIGGLGVFQTFLSTAIFCTVTMRIVMINRYRNIFMFIAYGVSILLFIGNLLLFQLGEFLGNDAGLIALQMPQYYLATIVVIAACLGPEYCIKYYRKQYHPSDADILHEYDVLVAKKKSQKETQHL